ERGIVVLLYADPVLFDLSPALLGGAAGWTAVVSDNWICGRIFRALRVARALAAKRIMGPWRLRDLSITRVRTRNLARDVAPSIERRRGMVSSSWRRFRGRIDPVSGGTTALSWPVRIHFRRFRHGRVLHA